jgi:hypothetical protein
MVAEHVDQLEADRIAERLCDLGHPHRLFALEVRKHDGLATALARRALGLWSEFEIDSDLYTDTD